MRCMGRALAAAVLAFALPASTAAAHGVVERKGSTITYSATDDPTLNTLTVRLVHSTRCHAESCIELADPTVEPGMEVEAGCREGAKDGQGNVHTVFCPRSRHLVVDAGDLDDVVRIRTRISATVRGGPGNDNVVASAANDRVFGGPGADKLKGGGGDDQLFGDLGADVLDGGAGDDELTSVDGEADTVRCGAGLDDAGADTVDAVRSDCETFTKVTDPNGTPPAVTARANRRQKVGGDRRIRFSFTAHAPEVVETGFVEIGRSRYSLESGTVRGGPPISGDSSFKVPSSVVKRVRAGSRALARVYLLATDAAGNATRAAAPVILLTR
jgi:hypothetical protein